jgi:hypothetical protein
MKKQTAVEYLLSKISSSDYTDIKELINQAKTLEKEQIKQAILYSLDEDGHTGEWKLKFAKDYISKFYEDPTHI